MLHRDTYDKLSDTGLVLTWELTTAGGYIVVQDEDTNVFTVWREDWQGNLEEVDHVQLFGDADEFSLAQDLAKAYLVTRTKALTTV